MEDPLTLIIAVTLMIFTTKADMIRQEGYPSETHHITTEDGYILTVFRIPGPPGSIPVLLQHGLLESSASWLITGERKSLAYILSDHGFDVWLGNARGNTFSKNHTTFDISDPEFWDFSWHEIGYYDLPAVINYITDLKKDRIFYIGHSMGCSTFAVMAAEKPEVARKVKAMFALAPAVYGFHMKNFIKQLSPFWRQLQIMANSLGIDELLSRSRFFDSFSRNICESVTLGDIACSSPLFIMAGFDPSQLDFDLLPKIWNEFPAGTSMKVYTHWLQQINVNEFRRFDYGEKKNMKHYNSTKPPKYDISKIQVPITVFWSRNDLMTVPQDVLRFYDEVPFQQGIYEINNNEFNHFDFLWGIDAPRLVYPKILSLIANHKTQVTTNVSLDKYKTSIGY